MSDPGVRYDETTKRTIVRLYEKKKLSAAAISRLEDMPTQKTVLRILREQGAQLRGNAPRFDRKAIKTALRKNNPVPEIAKKHGCSERLVFRIKRTMRKGKGK